MWTALGLHPQLMAEFLVCGDVGRRCEFTACAASCCSLEPSRVTTPSIASQLAVCVGKHHSVACGAPSCACPRGLCSRRCPPLPWRAVVVRIALRVRVQRRPPLLVCCQSRVCRAVGLLVWMGSTQSSCRTCSCSSCSQWAGYPLHQRWLEGRASRPRLAPTPSKIRRTTICTPRWQMVTAAPLPCRLLACRRSHLCNHRRWAGCRSHPCRQARRALPPPWGAVAVRALVATRSPWRRSTSIPPSTPTLVGGVGTLRCRPGSRRGGTPLPRSWVGRERRCSPKPGGVLWRIGITPTTVGGCPTFVLGQSQGRTQS